MCWHHADRSCGWCQRGDDANLPEGCPPHEDNQHWLGCHQYQLRDDVLARTSGPAWEVVLAGPLTDDETIDLAEALIAAATPYGHRLPLAISLEAAVEVMRRQGYEAAWMRRQRPS